MFLDKDFMLKSDFSKKVYHDYVEKMPIVDYHCHLEPKEIYENKKFTNITQAWLGGDHYKWRLMRANGVPEHLITGDGDDYQKFLAWAETIEGCLGNPLYVWSHLELTRIFGIEDILSQKTAGIIWEKANKILQQDNMSTRELIKSMNVKVICTTDNPLSDLSYHQLLSKNEKNFKVLPTFRPDGVINITDESFPEYLKELSTITNIKITNYQDMLNGLQKRIKFFHSVGCRLSDHSFTELKHHQISEKELQVIFEKGINNQLLSKEEVEGYQYQLLCDLMKLYHKQSWTCQLHLQATRSNNSYLLESIGADVGGDGMNDGRIVEAIGSIFDTVNKTNQLPKVILYSLNPSDFIPLITLMGCFQGEEKNKIQFGSAWWFNDTNSGMRHQLTALAEGSILGNFVGMLTDSRSFLSYPRHEYFRRILCQLVGEWVEEGQLPSQAETIGPILTKIAYTNAIEYFNFD